MGLGFYGSTVVVKCLAVVVQSADCGSGCSLGMKASQLREYH